MKFTKHYMKRSIAGETILIPVGEMASQFNGMITLNETGEFICKCLEEGLKEEEIIARMLEEYEADEADVRQEVTGFLAECRRLQVITE